MQSYDTYMNRLKCCASTPRPVTRDCSCNVTVNVDCSCNPTILVDLSSIVVDVSCQPVINIDLSSIVVDVSCQPVINIDLSNIIIDVSSQPIVTDVTVTSLPNTDAFARLRVSNPFTLFEFTSVLGKNEYLIEEATGGGGLSTFVSGLSYINMSVTASGDYVIRQSREYITYQPGKSKLIYMTGVLLMDASATNITSRIGAFDASMGFFVEYNNGVINVVRTNSVKTTVPRGAWTDPLDGTGPSGVFVDFTKAQIFTFDFEWLGSGQVRCGIVIGGVCYYYYIFTHINELIEPYIQMASLPLRYEIRSNGSANSMHMICGTVISEGGISPLGKIFKYGNFLGTGIPLNSNNPQIRVPIFGIRLRNTNPYNRVSIKLRGLEIINTTTAVAGSWQLLLNPTIVTDAASPAPTWLPYYPNFTSDPRATDSAAEIIQYGARTNSQPNPGPLASDVSGGLVLYSGFLTGRDSTNITFSIDEYVGAYPLTTGIDGTVSDEWILVVNTIVNSGGGTQIYAIIDWIEIL